MSKKPCWKKPLKAGMRLYFLLFSDIPQIHEDAIMDSGGGTGLRDKAGIESAVAAPQASYFGQEQIILKWASGN